MAPGESTQRVSQPIGVTGVGLVTPVGHDSVSAPAAIRAGISRFKKVKDFVGGKGAGAVAGVAYGLTDDRSGSDRLLAMAVPAVQEALSTAEAYCRELDAASMRVVLSLSPPDRPRYEEFEGDDLATLLELAELHVPMQAVEIVRDGHAGGMVALARAAELLRLPGVTSCLIVAVDSLAEYPAMKWLDEAGRLKTDTRGEGFIPGESAAALVIERASDANARGAEILAELAGAACTREEAGIFSRKPLFADGLAKVIKETLSSVGGRVDGIVCDLNGEYYRMKEWALASTKLFGDAPGVPELWHPAENIGDIGAASALVHTAMAVAGGRKGYFPGPSVLVWASSDAGMRGSVVVRSA